MSRKRYRFFLVALASVCISGLPGCGHDQKLESITVQPSGFVFEGIGAKGQFTAIGTYIHPPESKDITNHVLWQIDVANLATITQSGSVSALSVCGSGNVTATVYCAGFRDLFGAHVERRANAGPGTGEALFVDSKTNTEIAQVWKTAFVEQNVGRFDVAVHDVVVVGVVERVE